MSLNFQAISHRAAFLHTYLPSTSHSKRTVSSFTPSASPAHSHQQHRHTFLPKTRCPSKISTPQMLQSPHGDGPPPLPTLANSMRRSTACQNATPFTISTARQQLSPAASDADVHSAAAECMYRALDSLRERSTATPSTGILAHVTATPDVSAGALLSGVRSACEGAVVGRSVRKENTNNTIEVLLLCGGDAIATAMGSGDSPTAAAQIAVSAAQEQLGKNGALNDVDIFAMFSITASSVQTDEQVKKMEEDVREAISEKMGPLAAYGGAAQGGADGMDWWMATGDEKFLHGGSKEGYTVTVSLLCGQVSFLTSAVVKSWAQPAYVRKASYLTPKYMGGDGKEDLLTAIKFNDWDKYTECMEVYGIDVNMLWTEKQRQSPLLAAVSRGRVRMVRDMLSRGADVTHRNDSGYDAVMYANKLDGYGDGVVEEIMGMLREYGVDC